MQLGQVAAAVESEGDLAAGSERPRSDAAALRDHDFGRTARCRNAVEEHVAALLHGEVHVAPVP